jgi:hypothetical protein
MRLIGLAVVFTVGLVLAPLAAEPQQEKVYRVGLLAVLSPPAPGNPGPFAIALRDLGYVEGRTSSLIGDGRRTETSVSQTLLSSSLR